MPPFAKHDPGSFCLFELCTTDRLAALDFYKELMGWQSADNASSPVGTYTMLLSNGRDVAGAYEQLPAQKEAGLAPFWDLYVAVESADETAGKVAALGGRVLMPPFDVATYARMAVIADPAGGVLCVWQAKSHRGASLKGEPGSFSHAELTTPDPDAAARFYGGLFGWTSVGLGGGHSRILNHQSEPVGAMRPFRGGPGGRACWTCFLQASDLAATTAHALELGAQVLAGPHDMEPGARAVVIRDPQGAVLSLFATT